LGLALYGLRAALAGRPVFGSLGVDDSISDLPAFKKNVIVSANIG
jgi:hypothetical protein